MSIYVCYSFIYLFIFITLQMSTIIKNYYYFSSRLSVPKYYAF